MHTIFAITIIAALYCGNVKAASTLTTNQQQEAIAMQAEKNLKDSAAFLAENKTKAGVITCASGLQYKILEPGTGKHPTKADLATVHYKGTLIDGTQFDSSYDRGEPTVFPVSGVIAGWTEALTLMQPGAKWQLVIPAELAYGAGGAGTVIGPNMTLIFEVTLLSVAAQ